MRLLFFVFAIVLLCIAVIFSLLNVQEVQLDYYFGHLSWPLFSFIVLSFVLGGVCGLSIGYYKGWSRKRKSIKKV